MPRHPPDALIALDMITHSENITMLIKVFTQQQKLLETLELDVSRY
jgi:hypothetical protein